MAEVRLISLAKRIERNPLLFVVTAVAAVYTGLRAPAFSASLAPLSEAYLNLLKSVMLPYLLAAIIGSVARTVAGRQPGRHMASIFLTLLALLTVGVMASLAFVIAIRPGHALSEQARVAIADVIRTGEPGLSINLFGKAVAPHTGIFRDSILSFLPNNIFASLASGQTLQVALFSLLFGLAFHKLEQGSAQPIINLFDAIQKACEVLIIALVGLLPIALFATLSSVVAVVGVQPIKAMSHFVVFFLLAETTLSAACLAVVAWRSRTGFTSTLIHLRALIFTAFVTRSSIATLPAAMEGMVTGMRYRQTDISVVMPLALTLSSIGKVSYFVFATSFVANLYGMDLSVYQYVLMALASAVASFMAAGASGPVVVLFVSGVASVVGIPAETAIPLFLAIDPILGFTRTVTNVCASCTAVSLVCEPVGSGVRAAERGAHA